MCRRNYIQADQCWIFNKTSVSCFVLWTTIKRSLYHNHKNPHMTVKTIKQTTTLYQNHLPWPQSLPTTTTNTPHWWKSGCNGEGVLYLLQIICLIQITHHIPNMFLKTISVSIRFQDLPTAGWNLARQPETFSKTHITIPATWSNLARQARKPLKIHYKSCNTGEGITTQTEKISPGNKKRTVVRQPTPQPPLNYTSTMSALKGGGPKQQADGK